MRRQPTSYGNLTSRSAFLKAMGYGNSALASGDKPRQHLQRR
jgi:hypothetical protein